MALTKNRIRSVLMTTDTVGGVWTYCIDLVKVMRSRNIHFHLVSAGGPLSEAQRSQVSELENVTLHETDFKLEWMNNPWNDIDFSGWHLLELERMLKPDVIHLNSYSYAALPFKAPVIVVAHSDVFSWWFSVRKSIPGPEWQEYFRRVKDGLRGADCVVAPSQSMMDLLDAIYGPSADERVIHNGRSNKDFRPGVKQPTIMCAGRFWDEAKNLELLAEASGKIDAEIKIAGDVNSRQRHRPGGNMRFLGKLSPAEMSAELASSLVYVAPAKYEPFGLSILEAALSGCALVLGNISSLREIWNDSAMYVATDKAEDLARLCNTLLKDEETARQYGAKALERAKTFSLEIMGNRYANLYNELVISRLGLKTMQIA